MSTVALSSGRRLKSFRLSDVPLPIRRRAARYMTDKSDSIMESFDITRACEHPSEKVYVVSQEAWNRVVGG
jgi:hypothetical protein